MGARSKARRRALDVLFQADLMARPASDVLAELTSQRRQEGLGMNPYTIEIVAGVVAHQDRIDEWLSTYAIGWTLDRMPSVDRNVLRIGAWELMFNPEIDDAVAISEATAMAAELSTDQSPVFVQGLLGRIVSLREVLAQE